jgi:glycosyltransferase involved in cell wall biosynthesis
MATASVQNSNISVVVVTRNRAHYLTKALHSIFAQTHLPSQVIVIDGHSSDETQEVVKKWAGVQYVLQNGLGLASARNQALQLCTGEWVAFLDSDDSWHPEKLARQYAQFCDKPTLDVCLCRVQLYLQEGTTPRGGISHQQQELVKAGLTPGAVLMRQSVVEKIGLFDENLQIACDSDWFARLIDSTLEKLLLPEILLYKRIHTHNLSANVQQYRSEVLQMLKRSIARKKT